MSRSPKTTDAPARPFLAESELGAKAEGKTSRTSQLTAEDSSPATSGSQGEGGSPSNRPRWIEADAGWSLATRYRVAAGMCVLHGRAIARMTTTLKEGLAELLGPAASSDDAIDEAVGTLERALLTVVLGRPLSVADRALLAEVRQQRLRHDPTDADALKQARALLARIDGPRPYPDPETANLSLGACTTAEHLTKWWRRVEVSPFADEERQSLLECAERHFAKLAEVDEEVDHG